MKTKNIVLLTVILLLVCLVAGCSSEDLNTEPTYLTPDTQPSVAPTVPDTDNTQPTTVPTEPTIDVETDEKLVPTFIEYDEKYQDFKTLWSSVDATIIPFPSTKIATETFMEEFYTAEEFKAYLDEYSDLVGHKNAKIEINDEGFIYQHGFSTYGTKGFVPRFFFLSSTVFQPLYRIDVEEVKYDKETKSVYIIIKIDDAKHSLYATGQAMQDNIDNNTKGTYAILYFDIDEELDVKHLYFVLPE